MNCAKCGADLPADARFCPACGAATEAQATVPAAGVSATADRIRRIADQGVATAAGPPGENELWRGSYSPKDMAGIFLAVAVISITAIVVALVWGNLSGTAWLWLLGAIAVVWLALGLQLAYRRMSIRYRLTDQRFFHERGILTRIVDRIEVIDMDDITYVQGIIERMFGTGTIKVTSSDRTHPEIQLRGIDQVREVAAMLDAARRQERLRRGFHIEAI
jgi:membrane protein YdbS with pleckstrin-like domain